MRRPSKPAAAGRFGIGAESGPEARRGEAQRDELALDADVGAHRLEPAGADAGEQLPAELEGVVVAADDRGAGLAALGEDRRLVDSRSAARAHHPASADEDGVDRERGRAEDDLAERVVQRRERERVEVEQHEVGPAARLDATEAVPVSGGGGAVRGRHRPGGVGAEPLLVVDLPELVQERRGLDRSVHVVSVVRAHAVGAERDVHAGASRSGTGQMPEPSFMFDTGLWTIVTP